MLDSNSFWKRIQVLEGKSVATLTKLKLLKIVKVDDERIYIAGRNQPLLRFGKRGLFTNYCTLYKKGKLDEYYWSAALPIIQFVVPDEVEQVGSTLRLKSVLAFNKFSAHIESLKPKIEYLLDMTAVTADTLPDVIPMKGVYLFSENNKHLYVGRSDDIRGRIRRHTGLGATHRMAAFAFRLARETTGYLRATYRVGEGSRSELMKNQKFREAFSFAKERIRKMQLRFVEEEDPVRQALLEIYVSVVLETPYNKFNTT